MSRNDNGHRDDDKDDDKDDERGETRQLVRVMALEWSRHFLPTPGAANHPVSDSAPRRSCDEEDDEDNAKDDSKDGASSGRGGGGHRDVEGAVRRTIPLLRGGYEAPFLCRYRPDAVRPLLPAQVRLLGDMLERHESLSSLRRRALAAVRAAGGGGGRDGGRDDLEEICRRIVTATSRSELEDLYGPYKPPAKGTLSERISSDRPDVSRAVEAFWSGHGHGHEKGGRGIKDLERLLRSRAHRPKDGGGGGGEDLSPRDCVVHLLGSKIAANTRVCDTAMDLVRSKCVVSTKKKKAAASSSSKTTARYKKGSTAGETGRGGAPGGSSSSSSSSKYDHYADYECRTSSLSDHAVLAIRRGTNAGEIRSSFTVPDVDYVKRQIRNALIQGGPDSVRQAMQDSHAVRSVITDAIDDAWTRLLRRRTTSAAWREKLASAEERAISCFAENLRGALMMPPLSPSSLSTSKNGKGGGGDGDESSRNVLAVDPGFGAGTKVALLTPSGALMDHPKALTTIRFLGGTDCRSRAVKQFEHLLRFIRSREEKQSHSHPSSSPSLSHAGRGTAVLVALGNGHGSDESKSLIEEASSSCGVPCDVRIVDEAGASVWSVTDDAGKEFPGREPASIGAVSIGRRLQDPMSELVRVPPRSLGLGMYQHDLPEKELDRALKHASVDAVALVGVDGNSASVELLRNIPGLSRAGLAEEVVKARPLRCRDDLNKVKGLGPKTYENCAGFIRIRNGKEELDSTRVHPESYPLARWIMRKLKCPLTDVASALDSAKSDKKAWAKLLSEASTLHGVSLARVDNVAQLLQDSDDPRLRLPSDATDGNVKPDDGVGGGDSMKQQWSRLSAELATSLAKLKDACPVRNVEGRVRNVTDFGVFIDFGGENDGLMHVSKAGPNGLMNLSVGKSVGVDIIGVCVNSGRVSLSLAGLGHDAIESRGGPERKRKVPPHKPKGGKRSKRR